MAYVLVAIGALMAAAGLYVIGYSAFYVRFEEYWVSLSAGTTLLAGGSVTAALGLALRALGSALAVRPPAGLAIEPAMGRTEQPAPLPPPEPEWTAEHRTDDISLTPTAPNAPHPLRGAPSQRQAEPLAHMEPPAASDVRAPDEPIEESGAADAMPDASVAAAHQDGPATAPPVTSHDTSTPAELPDAAPSRPTYDRGGAFPSLKGDVTSDASPLAPPMTLPVAPPFPPPLPPRSTLPTPPAPPQSQEMPDDWLDRALAELDQELPIAAPPPRAAASAASLRPQDTPIRTDAPPTQPVSDPEPTHTAAAGVTSAPPASESEHAGPAVIGRYEADGTSYVMYSDGSIEAQSSGGVYRFSSMAELKSFIEN